MDLDGRCHLGTTDGREKSREARGQGTMETLVIGDLTGECQLLVQSDISFDPRHQQKLLAVEIGTVKNGLKGGDG